MFVVGCPRKNTTKNDRINGSWSSKAKIVELFDWLIFVEGIFHLIVLQMWAGFGGWGAGFLKRTPTAEMSMPYY